jgi:hypothetical protein
MVAAKPLAQEKASTAFSSEMQGTEGQDQQNFCAASSVVRPAEV